MKTIPAQTVVNGILFLSFFWGVQVPVLAAPAVLQWEDVLDKARENNPRLPISSLNSEAARLAHRQSFSGYLPKLTLKASQNKTKTEALSRTSRETDKSLSATATLNVFDGFSTTNNVKKSKASLLEAKSTEALTSAEVRRDLRKAFVEAQSSLERLRVLERTLERRKQNEKLVSLKYENGSEARWNLRKAKADTARAESQALEARLKTDSAREALLIAIFGDTSEISLSALAPLSAPEISLSEANPSISEHPRIQKLRSIEERLSRTKAMARAAFMPSIDLSATRSRSDSFPASSSRLRTDSSSYGIVASWNIFNGASDTFALQQANVNFEAASLDRQREERRLNVEVRESKRTFEGARSRIPSAIALREAAEERLKTVTTQYRAGLRGYLEWEQAETLLGEAEQAEIAAKQSAWNALADLEFIFAKGLEVP